MSNRIVGCFAALVVGFALVCGALAAPISTLYMLDGDGHTMVIVNGLTTTNVAMSATDREYAVAVGNTVRSWAAYPAQNGHEYSLTGTPLFVNYPNNFGSQMLDGTTDNVSKNYALRWDTGEVYQTTRTWGTPTLLFDTDPGNTLDWTGITYQPSNNTFWLIGRGSHILRQFSAAGAPLQNFNVTNTNYQGLAFDTKDGTLWTWDSPTKTLVQFSTAGVQLSTTAYPTESTPANNIFGLEFPLPEPGSATLAGMAITGLLLRRRRD
jgi:hypothetical protein